MIASAAFAAAPATEATATGAPSLVVDWKRDRATVRVEAPAGSKISAEAPARVALGWGERSFVIDTDGALLSVGVSVGDLRGAALTGELEVSVCDLAGTTCTPTRWSVAGAVPSASKGSYHAALAAGAAHAERPFGPDATADAATTAFARAKQSGKPVLLDFSAVWCPPCNLLAAEVLHADPHPTELDGFEVAVLDVDHPSSFAYKNTYVVGGYPTVVVAKPDGTELSRTVGYERRETFLAWLAGAAGSTDAADLARPVAELSPDRAAELAWVLAQRGAPADPTALIARAAGSDKAELRLARFATEPTAQDLEWLLANAPDEALHFGLAATALAETHPELARAGVNAALLAARDSDVAAALEAAAELAVDEPTKHTLFAAAASVVASEEGVDPERDKAWIGWHADLLEHAGATDEAVALLTRSVAAYPDEPTFDLALTPLYVRLERCDEALASADRAMALSWGDNRLRAATGKAKALIACDRAAEGRALARATLDAEPAPALTEVRTHRYRAKLEELASAPAAAPTAAKK